MKKIIPFLLTLGINIPLYAAAPQAAPQLPPIDAGTIWNQINNSHNPFPQPQPTTLDYCNFSEFKNNKCLFKCQSGAVLTEPAVKPDFSSGEPTGPCAIMIIRPIPAPFPAKSAEKVNPFPTPNPDSCYLLGLNEEGLCRFKCRNGDAFQIKPVKPAAESLYEKCGADAYRGPQLPDAGSILAQIQQQQAAQQQAQQMIVPPALQFAIEAASSLRKDLKSYGVKAKVSLVNLPGGRYALGVEFRNQDDYDQVSDMFYQDPGDNPSYMDLKVIVSIDNAGRDIEPRNSMRAAETITWDGGERMPRVCWLKAIEKDNCIYKCKDGSAYTQPMQRPDPWQNEPVIACPQLVLPFK